MSKLNHIPATIDVDPRFSTSLETKPIFELDLALCGLADCCSVTQVNVSQLCTLFDSKGRFINLHVIVLAILHRFTLSRCCLLCV